MKCIYCSNGQAYHRKTMALEWRCRSCGMEYTTAPSQQELEALDRERASERARERARSERQQEQERKNREEQERPKRQARLAAREVEWQSNYDHLLAFFKEHGHSSPPENVKSGGRSIRSNLYEWTRSNRLMYQRKLLSQPKIALLNELEFDWEARGIIRRWEKGLAGRLRQRVAVMIGSILFGIAVFAILYACEGNDQNSRSTDTVRTATAVVAPAPIIFPMDRPALFYLTPMTFQRIGP